MKVISDTAEYALRAAVWLAREPERCCTTQEIAQATQTPPDYLAKVLKQMARGGVLEARRGIGGGFRLKRLPAQLSVLEIVNSVDPLERIHACPLGRVEHGKKLCPLHRRIDNALLHVESAFAQTRLVDLLEGASGALALCEEGCEGDGQ